MGEAFEIMENRKESQECTLKGNIHKYKNIVTPIRKNIGETINIYRYFESTARFYGSFPCSICNSENNIVFKIVEDKFQIYSSNINCLNQVYSLEMALRMVEFLKKTIAYVQDLSCLFKGIHSENFNKRTDSGAFENRRRSHKKSVQLCETLLFLGSLP